MAHLLSPSGPRAPHSPAMLADALHEEAIEDLVSYRRYLFKISGTMRSILEFGKVGGFDHEARWKQLSKTDRETTLLDALRTAEVHELRIGIDTLITGRPLCPEITLKGLLAEIGRAHV